MSESETSRMVDEVAAELLEGLDDFVDELVNDLADVGNPEKLIGKKYAEWTPQDLAALRNIYGDSDNSPLGRTIARSEYQKLLDLKEANATEEVA